MEDEQKTRKKTWNFDRKTSLHFLIDLITGSNKIKPILLCVFKIHHFRIILPLEEKEPCINSHKV
jgi:hypothetical protein